LKPSKRSMKLPRNNSSVDLDAATITAFGPRRAAISEKLASNHSAIHL
jgi:hypothetical protein